MEKNKNILSEMTVRKRRTKKRKRSVWNFIQKHNYYDRNNWDNSEYLKVDSVLDNGTCSYSNGHVVLQTFVVMFWKV